MVEGIVETAALEAIKENPQAVADYRAVVMKKTKRKADARAVREVLMGSLVTLFFKAYHSDGTIPQTLYRIQPII